MKATRIRSCSLAHRLCCYRVIVASLVLAGLHAVSAVGQQAANSGSSVSPHGNMESLAEFLVTSPQRERQLLIIHDELQNGRFDLAIELLAGLLDETPDAFLVDAERQSVLSLNQQIIQLLKSSPESFRRRWDEFRNPVAQASLNEAVKGRDFDAIRQVARRHVFTRTGLAASSILIGYLIDKGDVRQAAVALKVAEQTYSSDDRFRQQLAKIRSSVQRSIDRRPDTSGAESTVGLFPATAESASMPWPQPLWSWKASFADSYDATGLSEQVLNVAVGSHPLRQFYNWRPVILNNIVIQRSPLRIVALDRKTGKPVWSIQTDTAISDKTGNAAPGGSGDDGGSLLPSLLTPELMSDLIARAAFGTMTTDGQHLYFVDGFRAVRRQDEFDPDILRRPGIGLRRRNGFGILEGNMQNREFRRRDQDQLDPDLVPERQLMGSRLVAVKLNANAEKVDVAWIAGDTKGFRYQVSTTTTEGDKSRAMGTEWKPSETDAKSPDPQDRDREFSAFNGHQFLTAPVTQGGLLFVVSGTSSEQILNCLDRNSGKLVWRQTLIYDDSIPIEFLSAPTTADTATAIFLTRDNVICSLANGTVICARQSDGTLNWGTSLRDQQTQRAFAPYARDSSHGHDSVGFFSVTNNDILVGASSASSYVYAVNLVNGEILWQVNRSAFGAGVGADEEDLYAAGITADHVILIGKQHCRALDLTSGLQSWVTEISASTGRAWCCRNVCLVPEADGRLARIDLESGQVYRVVNQLLPEGSTEVRGAVNGDGELVYVSTSNSISAFNRSDALLDRLNRLQSDPAFTADRDLIRAQALLLDGQPGQAIQSLLGRPQQLADIAESDRSVRFAANLILQLTAESLFHSDLTTFPAGGQLPDKSGSRTDDSSKRSASLSPDEIRTYLQTLATLPLTDEQQSRFRVFMAIAFPDDAAWQDWMRPLIAERSRDLIDVDGDWTSRAALIAMAELPERILSASWPEADEKLRSREMFADAVLFPQRYGGAEGILQLAEIAIERNDDSAAELLLLKGIRDLIAGDGGLQREFQLRLNQVRGAKATVRSVGDHQSADYMQPSRAGAYLYRRFSGSVVIDEEQTLRTPDSLGSEIDTFRYMIDAPVAAGSKWMVQTMDDKSQTKTLAAFGLNDGSCTDRLSLKRDYLNSGARLHAPFVPTMLLLSDRERVAAISCLQPGNAQLLWETSVRDSAALLTRQVAVGPVGPDYVIWRTASRIHCSHPLTGKELWSRQCSQYSDVEQLFSSELIFGDHLVTVVLDPRQGSYRRYRTMDGRLAEPGLLEDMRLDGCVTVGRKLLCADSYGRVMLFDAISQTNLLHDAAAVIVAGAEPIFRQVSENLVITVSNTQEIIIIDVSRNRITARIPIAGLVNTRFVFGLTAFQQNGLLYVCVNDEQAMGQHYVAMPRLGEPRLNYGSLFCIDTTDNQILWSRRVDPFVVPSIQGDACPMMLMWSHVMPVETEGNLRFRSQRNNRLLRLQILDVFTGEILAERSNLQPAYPIRCVYDASCGEMTLYSQGSVITVSHQPQQDEVDFLLK